MTVQETPGATLANGIVAGVAATAAMVATRDALYRAEPAAVRAREEALRVGVEETALQRPVRAIATRAGLRLTPERERQAGKALAWGLGIAGVAAYAFARERVPAVRAGRGLAFGLAAWAVEDEGVMTMIAGRPWNAYPWQAHARGLAAHAAYGLVAETALGAMDARADGRAA